MPIRVTNLRVGLDEPDDAARRRLMTFVVAGGGFAGIETVGAINDFLRESLKHFPELDPSIVRMVLVHAGGVILPELGTALGAYAQRKLSSRGIEILTHARVSAVTDRGVVLGDNWHLPAGIVVWTAGTGSSRVRSRSPR